MPDRAPKKFGTIATVAVLLVLLAAALWYAASAFVVGGPPMPAIGVAMAGGIVISLAVGFGLMGLLFYSSRHGYDEPVDQHIEPKDRP